MRLRHLEVFNAIMLTGSISAAARLINVTQPAVSRTLQHAESQLGFALFKREKGRLVATREAQTLHPRVETIFNQLLDVDRLAKSLRSQGNVDELRVATVMALTPEILPRALKAFRARQPAVSVRIEALHSPQIVSSLLLRTADIGFTFSSKEHPGLTQTHLADSRLVCIVPHGLPSRAMKQSGKVSLGDLAKLPVIEIDGTDPVGLIIAQACHDNQIGLSSIIKVQTYHAALAMAHHGLGVAIVDAWTALSADPAKVSVLRLKPDIPIAFQALRQTHQPDSIAATTLSRCVQKALAAA